MTYDQMRAAAERLREKARSLSDMSRSMAEAKSLRQGDNPDRRTDLYEWAPPEKMAEWIAATAIDTLLEATKARVAVEREECARVADRWTEHEDEHCSHVAQSIATAIRARTTLGDQTT